MKTKYVLMFLTVSRSLAIHDLVYGITSGHVLFSYWLFPDFL